MADDEKTPKKQDGLMHFFRKIPLFSDLSKSYLTSIYKLCSKKMLNEGEVLCNQGDISDSMYILIRGKLAVKIKKSATIATINPVGTIGELGVFTGEPRSATVQAMENSVLLVLKKNDLDSFIDKYQGVGVTIMRNVIQELSQRLRDDNIRLREFQRYIIDQEENKLKNIT